MMDNIKLWLDKLDALSLRERLLILSAGIALLYTICNMLFLQPMQIEQKKLSQQVKQGNMELSARADEIAARVQANRNDPDALARQRLQTLQAKLAVLHQQLQARQQGLIAADKVPAMLQEILSHHEKVQVRSLKTMDVMRLSNDFKTLAADSLVEEKAMKERLVGNEAVKPKLAIDNALAFAVDPAAAAAAAEAASAGSASSAANAVPANPSDKAAATATAAAAVIEVAPKVYRHEVVLELVGSYLDLLAYVQELEKMSWQLYWGKASLTVEKHPQAVLRLHIYTLSLDKKWLDL